MAIYGQRTARLALTAPISLIQPAIGATENVIWRMLPLHTDQPPQIYDGYQSVSPLPLDFLDRQPIYQLYTLLNRARLFGGQQLVIAQKAMDRLLAV
ncbi:Ribulosamine/erythrulosamine 3- kinase potentially involved in protein deglycation [Salmonella enterica subsp. diarizonae]|uniref:Ribulosamine/erythrulosamine 3- kinase potentially involved in protein deglycation n=1 Tax=Salmonella diarizonae TaxID=59204 RepID=A0A379TZ38_SALDZ|nr:Ribulosamine/erythrulosamine 3- kinase potentially involved in protein deglycation [Salmonella enterica subsp. diarizonae]